MWIHKNENPLNERVGDCVIRAISTALSQSWEKTFVELCVQAFMDCDLPSSNSVWAEYLKNKGFEYTGIPNIFNRYTVQDFCKDHPKGTYILGTGKHALTVIDGNYYDVWNSGKEIPIYYFTKEV